MSRGNATDDRPDPRGRTRPVEGPDFIVIGAAKSGTTTLYHYLIQHPGIFMVADKEPAFFSDPDWERRGLNWYARLFADAAPHQVRGEASTTYTRWPHTADAPARIAELYPNTRFIYLMRHPVDRAYSHYAHHMRAGITMTFEQALEQDDIYLDCSRYKMQLDRYLRYFPEQRFLFLTLDDLSRDPERLLADCFRFLGVDAFEIDRSTPLISNSDRDARARQRLNHLARRLRTHRLGRLGRAVVPGPLRHLAYDSVRRLLRGRGTPSRLAPPPMLEATRRRLVERFAAENGELATLLRRDLSHWNE